MINALKEETLTIKTEIEDLAEVEVVDTMTEDKTKIVVSKTTVEVTEKTVDLVVIKEEVSKNEITTIVEEIVISTIAAEETVVSTNLKMILMNPIY